MSKVLFIPFGIVGGLLAGAISKKLFDLVWGRIGTEEAPEPEHRDVSWPELVAALALQGAIFRVARGVVERGSRVWFYRLTGTWPGEEQEPTT
jgi:hypothetical protein